VTCTDTDGLVVKVSKVITMTKKQFSSNQEIVQLKALSLFALPSMERGEKSADIIITFKEMEFYADELKPQVKQAAYNKVTSAIKNKGEQLDEQETIQLAIVVNKISKLIANDASLKKDSNLIANIAGAVTNILKG
jgi:formyltetrahydrofolate hydrolase